MNKLAWLLVGMLLLSGCMNRTANPVAQYQYGDEKKPCTVLRAECSQLEADITRKIGEKDSNSGKNAALGAAGVFFLVPFFFMDLSDSDRIELEALRQRHNALARMAVEKECSFDTKEIKFEQAAVEGQAK